MGPTDLLWHLLNFFAVPVLLGVVAGGGARLIWWRRLAGVPVRHLASAATGASAATQILGLLLFGRDGAMATDALMVLASACALWWTGFRRR